MFKQVIDPFRNWDLFAVYATSRIQAKKPDSSDAFTVWRMQFTEVDPADLSETKAEQFAKICEEFPDAVVGRVGESEFACFVDAKLGPTHVILRDDPMD